MITLAFICHTLVDKSLYISVFLNHFLFGEKMHTRRARIVAIQNAT